MPRAVPVVAGFIASSASCAQLAGIDQTNGNARVVDTVAVQRMSIGTTVEVSSLDVTGLAASFLVASEASATGFDRVPASVVDGRWTSDLIAPAPVVVTLPEGPAPVPRLYAFPANTLSILVSALEHPNRSPAPDAAMLAVTAQLEAASTADDSFGVYTVGSWTAHPLATGVVDAMEIALTYPFHSSSNLSGRAQFDQLTTQDAFLILRYTAAALTGVAEATPFVQTGNDTVTATMAAVNQDLTLDVKIAPAVLAARYAPVRPAVGPVAINWDLVAAPSPGVAPNMGPVLYSGPVGAMESGVAVKYGNPFAGPPHRWKTMFALTSSASRVYPPTGTMSVTLFAGMSQFLDPPPAGATLPAPAGLPELISLDGKPLSIDGETVPPPGKFVAVSFIADEPNNTLYDLQVYDIVPDATATALEMRLVFAAETSETTFRVPPEVFQRGHSYTLRVLCTAGGYPNVGTGDLQTRALPVSVSFLDSGVFTVMP